MTKPRYYRKKKKQFAIVNESEDFLLLRLNARKSYNKEYLIGKAFYVNKRISS